MVQTLKSGVPKARRPVKPKKLENYPTIANKLLKTFVKRHPQIKIEAVTADAPYGHAAFMDEPSKITGNAQVISQIRPMVRIKYVTDAPDFKPPSRHATGSRWAVNL